ncbi:GNAT family N-acetyltransferase [Nonomuraea sp. NN258]|uniref:GNAT family N-acetyltransferase n=1 Tax=Nonomuraea antri TaxID=2730852 RepID=UPI0015690235|nr:GNAT family N-acetyltransferase [Nonomuraea antri]NRQ34970.1 GNAT family N-acetyltransferase [Nonomuraea antri]
MTDLRLPAGFRAGPASLADAPAIHRLVAAAEHDLLGRPETGQDAITADLARPGLDLAADTLLVHDPHGNPAARAWVNRGRRCAIDVHPRHRGLGLGGALLGWAEVRARRLGSPRLAQTIQDADHAATLLLRSRGYTAFVTQWLLQIALPTAPAVPGPPPGITVRPFEPGDEQAAYLLTEDAFDSWQQRRKSYQEWARLTVGRPTFAPAASPLAFAGGELVGAVLSLDAPGTNEGYVDRVAVRADHRGRGIAGLLLRTAFHALHQGGRRGCTLWTHSDTGALSLYERAGMTVRSSSTVYGKPLTDA